MVKLKVDSKEIDAIIASSIIKGVQASRLPLGFTLSPHAVETIKNAIWLKLEEGGDEKTIIAMIVSFNIGYSEGKYDGFFVEDDDLSV